MAEPRAKKQRLQPIRADLLWLFSSLAGYCPLASTEHTIGENVTMDHQDLGEAASSGEPVMTFQGDHCDGTQVRRVMINLG